jgi:hypothetical protein
MSLSWQQYVANHPRFVGTDRAFLFEAGGTNITPRPRGTGATIGTPGSLPTGWSVLPAGTITLASVVANGVTNGVEWTEYELASSGSGAGAVRPALPSVTSGLQYAGQMFVAYPGGAPGIVNSGSSGLRLGNTSSVFFPRNIPTDGAIAPISAVWTANATGATDWQLRFATTGAGTFRIRIGWNDLKQQNFISNPILANSGPVAIGADLLSLSLPALSIGDNGASTFWFDLMLPQVSGVFSFFHLGTSSATRLFMGVDGGDFYIRRETGGIGPLVSLGAASVGVRYGVAITNRGDGTARGVVHASGTGEVSGFAASGITAVRFNGNFDDTLLCNTQQRRVKCLPYSVSDAQLDIFAADAAAW